VLLSNLMLTLLRTNLSEMVAHFLLSFIQGIQKVVVKVLEKFCIFKSVGFQKEC